MFICRRPLSAVLAALAAAGAFVITDELHQRRSDGMIEAVENVGIAEPRVVPDDTSHPLAIWSRAAIPMQHRPTRVSTSPAPVSRGEDTSRRSWEARL